jgi:preprotein translocase subunit SecG
MFGAFLSNVSLGTANFLAYTMLLLVAIFLVSGPTIAYYFWRKNKGMKAAVPTESA